MAEKATQIIRMEGMHKSEKTIRSKGGEKKVVDRLGLEREI